SEGEGRWRDYVGGYDEWVAQRPAPAATAAKPARAADAGTEAAVAPAPRARPARVARLSAWELRELEELPDAIAGIEARQAALSAQLADGSLYRDAPAEVERINKELAALNTELEEKFARWELLESRRADT